MPDRRHALGAILSVLVGGALAADDFPTKPILMTIPASAGGGLDAIARALAEQMSRSLGQPVLVDNRPGAGGTIATNLAAKAHPDGYVVSLTLPQAVLNNVFLMPRMPYDPRRDLAFVSEICAAQVVMVVNGSVPVSTVNELLAWLRKNPSKATFGSWGSGSYGHIAGSHLAASRGVAMVHAPYKGEAPMIQDLVGGQLTWAFASLAATRQHIESGRLRALAVTGERRHDLVPRVPTLAEAGLTDRELAVTGGVLLVAPAATPPAVLARLEKASLDALNTPQVRARLQSLGFIPLGWNGKQSRANYDANFPVQEKLFKSLDIKPD